MTWHSPATAVCKCASLALLAVTVGFLSSCADEPPTEASSDSPTVQATMHGTASLELTFDVKGGGQQPDREWLVSLIPAGGSAFEITDLPDPSTVDPADFPLVQLTFDGTITFQNVPDGAYTFVAREVALEAPLPNLPARDELRDELVRILTLSGSFTAAAPQLEGENLSVLTDDNRVARVARFLATQVCLPKGKGKGTSVELQPASKSTLVDTDVLDFGCLTLDPGDSQKLKLDPEDKGTKQVDVFCDDVLSGDDAIGCSVYAMIKLADDFDPLDPDVPDICGEFDGDFDPKAHCGLVAGWGSAAGPNDPVTLTLPITTPPELIEFETVVDLGNGLQQSASFATAITAQTDEVSLASSLLVCEVFERWDDQLDPGDPAKEELDDVDPAGADMHLNEDGPIAEVNPDGFVVFDNDAGTDKEYFVRFNVQNADDAVGTMVMQFDAPGGGGTLSMNVDFSIDLEDLDGDGQLCSATASGGAVNAGIGVLPFGSLDPEVGDVLCTFVFTGIDAGIESGEYKVKVTKNGFTDQYPNASKDDNSRQPISLELADGASCENSPIFDDSRFGGIPGSRFGGIPG